MRRLLIVLLTWGIVHVQAQTVEKVAPGIWKIVFGSPEEHLPTEFKESPKMEALKKLHAADTPSVNLGNIHFNQLPSGSLAEIPADSTERFYGFGLQTNTFQQRGMRREIHTSSWTLGNTGFGHAPMPFYVSSKGYGVLVNSSRYITLYMASKGKLKEQVAITSTSSDVRLSPDELYSSKAVTPSNTVNILVRGSEGMELYIFDGPSMLDVIRRYNLFSGGGALPPPWAFGFKYRTKATFNAHQVEETVNYFREKDIPCDMIGLEPGWQSASYSCSFQWNPKNFPDPDAFIRAMNEENIKLNLWEHAYTHPTSPLFEPIVPYAGNYTVWSGAVPDFSLPEARRIFTGYHEREFVKKGILAFKLDECDAANFAAAEREWSFPDITMFPSGMDGVQMRQLFGFLYQQAMLNIYRRNDIRTMFDVRASYLFASPYSVVLYSDMYDHRDFIRMVVNSAFAGVNWSPEVRETSNEKELIRRMQTTVMSSHMVVNGWYLDLPPWLQYETEKNVKRQLLPNAAELEQKAKKLIELRMQLVPYLYSAFARYHFEGTPPFRSLVLDYPDDENVWVIDDEYMMGDNILCAPFVDSASTRVIYLPEGVWYDFNTNQKYEGGRRYTIHMSLDQIPMFVKDQTILPMAAPVEYITPETLFSITCRVYGKAIQPATLFEDSGTDYGYEKGNYTWVTLSSTGRKNRVMREGTWKEPLCKIEKWEHIP